MNVLSLFDGLSGGRIAFDRLGIKVDNYYSSEIDKFAIQVSNDNYPDIIRLGSIIDLTEEQLLTLPKIDLLIGGSPCQGFSLAGHQKGSSTKEGIDVVSLEQYLALKEQGFEFNGQSYLFWEYVRIWKIVKPTHFFLENVKITAKWLPMFNNAMGCEPIKINSNLMSAQNRLRFYWTNIPNVEQPTDEKLFLETVLEDKTDAKFTLIDELSEVVNYTSETYYNCAFTERRTEEAKRIRREHRIKHGGDFSPRRGKELVPRTDSKMNCLTATFSKKEHSVLDKNGVYRRLTPLEFERLQTLPDNYTKSVSDNQRYRMIGNGWTIDVICHFFKNIKGSGMKVLSLFDGLSGGRIALDRLGFGVDEYYASEIDKYAIQVAKDNWPLTKHIGSVVDIDTDDLPIIDLLIGGSPCQGFSFAGKRKGSATKEGIDVVSLEQYMELKKEGFEFDGQSYLFWEYMRILTALRKKNPNIKFMLENVMMTKKWKSMFDEAVGIDSIEINSSLMSAQSRKRLYWTNIVVDGQPVDKGITLKSIFGDNPLVHNLYGGFNETKPRIFLDKSPTIRAASGGGAIPSVMFDGKFKDDMTLEYAKANSRTISPEECEQLQTLPVGYTKAVSNTQRRKMIGNGWTIDVICHLLKNFKEAPYLPQSTLKVSDILF